MKNDLSSLYEQILLKESQKNDLSNPKNIEVGNLKRDQEAFGKTPKPVSGVSDNKWDKPKEGPQHKIDGGSTSKADKKTCPFKGNPAPKKNNPAKEPEEVEEDEVEPKSLNKENYTMNAFENLFKKTITEDTDELDVSKKVILDDDDDVDLSDVEASDEDYEIDDIKQDDSEDIGASDLIADLRDIHTRLTDILAKLDDVENEDLPDTEDDEDYSEEDFDAEFGNDELDNEEDLPVKESVDRPRVLKAGCCKKLQGKNNKVGRLRSKRKKAKINKSRQELRAKILADRKKALQKGDTVKSSIKKGDFFQ